MAFEEELTREELEKENVLKLRRIAKAKGCDSVQVAGTLDAEKLIEMILEAQGGGKGKKGSKAPKGGGKKGRDTDDEEDGEGEGEGEGEGGEDEEEERPRGRRGRPAGRKAKEEEDDDTPPDTGNMKKIIAGIESKIDKLGEVTSANSEVVLAELNDMRVELYTVSELVKYMMFWLEEAGVLDEDCAPKKGMTTAKKLKEIDKECQSEGK